MRRRWPREIRRRFVQRLLILVVSAIRKDDDTAVEEAAEFDTTVE